MTKVGKGEELNDNELFKNKRKPAIHWFALALLALHDYRLSLPARNHEKPG
jgi:hypothetical protein